MAKKLDGETYQGTAISVPISEDGQVAAYVWPLRILTVQRVLDQILKSFKN